jgi:uncharacterized protein (UPF0335 family)
MARVDTIGTAIERLWDSLKSERTASGWERKLKGAGYVKHRINYRGTKVPAVAVYDSTAVSCFQTYCDGFIGYTIPEDDNWFYMLPWRRVGQGKKEYGGYGDLVENDDLMAFMERLSDVALREMSRCGAYTALKKQYTDSQGLGIGYACVYNKNDRLLFKELDPQEVCISENEWGEVEVFVRHYLANAVDLTRRFPKAELKHCWQRVKKTSNGEVNDVEVYEAIVPWDYLYEPSTGEQIKIGDGKDFGHIVYVPMEREIVEEDSFYEMPVVAYSPYRDTEKSPYGDGMVSKYLEEIVRLNDMQNKKSVLFNKTVNPPMLVHQSLEGNYSGKSGAIVYSGDLSTQTATPLYAPTSNSYTAIVTDITEAKQNLRTLMNADLFRTLMSSTDSRKTAYEVSELKNEAVTLLSMQVGDYAKRVLEPMVKRVLRIKIREQKMDLPRGMNTSTALEIVDGSTVVLNSVFVRRLQAYLRNQGLVSGLQFIATVAQVEQTQSMQVVDKDAVLRAGLFGVGFPAYAIRKVAEVKKEREAQAKAQNAMAQSEMNANNAKAYSNYGRGAQSAKSAGMDEQQLAQLMGGQTSGTGQ